MRPSDDSTSTVFEVEISPLELFQDLGVLVIEGRVPELSQNGRRNGVHSWPVSNKSKKPCCFQEPKQELCKLASATRRKIDASFRIHRSLFIEVFGSINETNKKLLQPCRVHLDQGSLKCNALLLERWEIHIVKKIAHNETLNANMVLQAVRSYLHFSQLSAWWNKSHGSFPHSVVHRISSNSSGTPEFLQPPSAHKFPLTEISNSEAVMVQVSSLPRMDISEIMFLIKQHQNVLTFDGGGLGKGLSNNDNDNSKLITDHMKKGIPSHYSPNSKQILNAFASLTSSEPCVSGHVSSVKRKDNDIDSYCTSHARTSNCQRTDYVGEKYMKLNNENKKERTNYDTNACSLDSVCRNIFGNSPRSPTTTKTLQKESDKNHGLSLSELLQEENDPKRDHDLSSMLEGFGINNNNEDDDGSTDNDDEDEEDDGEVETYNSNEITNSSNCKGDAANELRPCHWRMRSKSTSPHFAAKQKQVEVAGGKLSTKPIAARRLAMVAGTVPVFNPNTGLPLSSSPAPIKKPRNVSETSCSSSLSKSNSLDDLQPCALGLSRSAPAPCNLLGNFEESVLNGRMQANGTLEGFWAELGASGSFCPKHVNLPIQIQYFSLSDDNAPSPYLGRVSLQDKRKKKKRYRLPKKGTVQLTIFNPNNTVVKVFIVLYDCQDMPPCTRTFVRQKVVSIRQHPISMTNVQTLHFLIHLSFVSSKNSHIYLHTDIRVIFRQRVPDEKLLTITDGPTNPKYTPIAKKFRRAQHDDVVDSN